MNIIYMQHAYEINHRLLQRTVTHLLHVSKIPVCNQHCHLEHREAPVYIFNTVDFKKSFSILFPQVQPISPSRIVAPTSPMDWSSQQLKARHNSRLQCETCMVYLSPIEKSYGFIWLYSISMIGIRRKLKRQQWSHGPSHSANSAFGRATCDPKELRVPWFLDLWWSATYLATANQQGHPIHRWNSSAFWSNSFNYLSLQWTTPIILVNILMLLESISTFSTHYSFPLILIHQPVYFIVRYNKPMGNTATRHVSYNCNPFSTHQDRPPFFCISLG